MRIVRALVFSPLIPLLGVGVVGIGMGYRSIVDFGMFVLSWSIFVYPLVVALALAGHLASRRLGLRQLRHFALGGILGGSVLCVA